MTRRLTPRNGPITRRLTPRVGRGDGARTLPVARCLAPQLGTTRLIPEVAVTRCLAPRLAPRLGHLDSAPRLAPTRVAAARGLDTTTCAPGCTVRPPRRCCLTGRTAARVQFRA